MVATSQHKYIFSHHSKATQCASQFHLRPMVSRLSYIGRALSSAKQSAKSAKLSTMASPSKVRLAILDDYQGISSSKFSHLNSRLTTTVFSETLDPKRPEQRAALISRLHPFDIVSVMRERTPLPADVLSALPNLKVVITSGPQNASIDISRCSSQGILVAGSPPPAPGQNQSATTVLAPSLESTKQHTWALILGLARNVARDDSVVKSGGWQTSLATGLTGKTLGVLGLGRLGSAVAKVAVLAFGMKICAWSSSLTQAAADDKAKALGLPEGAFAVSSSKEELFRSADVLSVHYVLSPRSRGIVGAEELAAMKPSALLINTSRGPLIDEGALLAALKKGAIRGAALDVYDTEPLPAQSEWRSEKWGRDGRSEVILSPHMGYAEEGVMHAWYEDAAENVERWLDGKELKGTLN